MKTKERDLFKIFRDRVKRNYCDMDAYNQLYMRPVASATNFDLRICRQHAIDLLLAGSDGEIMCEEYGEDENWVGLNPDDLHEDEGTLTLWDDYQTFELWIPFATREHIVTLLNKELEYHKTYELKADGSNLLEFRATMSPEAVKLFDELGEADGLDYPELERFKQRLEAHGVTFDYYLDAEPFDFKIIKPEPLK